MMIRRYSPDDDDAAATLTVYLRAIRETASRDYSPEQVAVWAPTDMDLVAWGDRRAAVDTRVAVINGEVVGFSDIDNDGYIDMLFVHPAHGRLGIATALLESVLEDARRLSLPALSVRGSLTARPVFERNGFSVVERLEVELDGVALTTFAMRRELLPDAGSHVDDGELQVPAEAMGARVEAAGDPVVDGRDRNAR
jgi:putative acetyltransferase